LQVWYSVQCYEQFMGIPIALRSSDTRDVMMTSYVRESDASQGHVTYYRNTPCYSKILRHGGRQIAYTVTMNDPIDGRIKHS